MNSTIEASAAASRADVLVADDLRKNYGGRQALQGLSFSLKAGRVMGFLGPNGAGKTTAIRILTTILKPDSGYFFVEGVGSESPVKIRSRIGVLPESLGFPKQITAIDFLIYFGLLYGRSKAEAKKTAGELLEEVGLQQRSKSLLGTFSRGMRQRLGIARALINDPAVVFLDEPTLGLDPRGQQELLETVKRIARSRNAGVVLCSHLISEIEGICDDVVILNFGQIIAKGTVAEVIGQGGETLASRNSLRMRFPVEYVARAREVLEGIPGVKGMEPIRDMEDWLLVELENDPGDDPLSLYAMNNRVLGGLVEAKIPLLSFEVGGGRLQDVFLHLTEAAGE